MQITFCNSNDKSYQKQLNALLKPIFLDFTFWYDLNLWDSSYESYSISQNGLLISNICVFKTELLFHQKPCQALSVGAVATKEGHRGKGYARHILEHILNKYPGVPIYLSANDSVTDFYPRFGFRRVFEKLPAAPYEINNPAAPERLAFDSPKVLNYVYHRTNFSALDCQNTQSIHLFHIYCGYLKEHIYEIPELDTMVIAIQRQNTLKIIGVFSLREISFSDLARRLPFQNVSEVEFGFMPYWPDLQFEMRPYETDPLFVRGVKCALGNFKFPELSVT